MRVRAVGTAFLRARPLIVAPVAVVNAVLASRGAPVDQRIALAIAFGVAIAVFALERWWLGRQQVGESWLAASLAATSLLLAIGCWLSGGVASPIAPLLLAPIVVTAAAFGRSGVTIASALWSLSLVGALAAVADGPFAPIAAPWSRAMFVVSFAGLLALSYAGVAGLVEAYVTTGEQLDRMRVAAIEEAASRMRATELVGAKVAHELKNPLAAIKALLQLLRDRVDATGATRVAVALGEVDRMDGIVRDYLSFAKPLADLEITRVDIRALADDIVAVLESRAELAGVMLSVHGDGAIDGDARRLREALWNLVDNAVSATPRGGRVSVEITARESAVVLEIADTGPGMPPELAAAPAFTTARDGGTGLGLTIARAAIVQHGGELQFRDRPGGGTLATITVPRVPGGIA